MGITEVILSYLLAISMLDLFLIMLWNRAAALSKNEKWVYAILNTLSHNASRDYLVNIVLMYSQITRLIINYNAAKDSMLGEIRNIIRKWCFGHFLQNPFDENMPATADLYRI